MKFIVVKNTLTELTKRDSALVARLFDADSTFVIGGYPVLSHAQPVISVKAYADIYDATATDYVLYDVEAWDQTPLKEQQNAASFYAQAGQMLHAHGQRMIAAPGNDLMNVVKAGTGTTIYDRMLSSGWQQDIAVHADVFVAQSQGLQTDPKRFADYCAESVMNVMEGNGFAQVFGGLTTRNNAPGTQIRAAYDAGGKYLDGFWLNWTGGTKIDGMLDFLRTL